tara:strand:- start:349 stop:486 length:138 start_codon:yes stop_codon:yes gene_type:complete
MGYGLGSDDLEELAYYNKNIQEMDNIKQDFLKKKRYLLMGISQKE